MSCIGPHRRWNKGVVFGGGDVHPWGDGAGDMRIALFGVVVGDGSGGEAHAAIYWRYAALDHFRHGCTEGGARGEVDTPEEADGRCAGLCRGDEGLTSLPAASPNLRAFLANGSHGNCGWVAGTGL